MSLQLGQWNKVLRKARFFALFTATLVWVISSCTSDVFPGNRSTSTAPDVAPVPTINATALANSPLTTLSQPGPWPYVTNIIAYQNKLWFSNSVVFGNHNSADIYSYDPATGTTHYERHLFSQSTGTPVVAEGLLYWPFEDPRFSADLGEYMVTNGQDWQWRLLPEGEAFHIHTMATHQDSLFAGTGAWAGRLQQSQDQGQTWKVVYEHPTPEGNVSRLTGLVSHQEALYGGITALRDPGIKLLRWQQQSFQPVANWPEGKRVTDLTASGDWLYGINQNPDDSLALWRTNGKTSEHCKALDGYRIRALAAGNDGLWAVSSQDQGGYLWHSADGQDWTAVQQFNEILPVDVSIIDDHVYVGGRNSEGQGVLLGQATQAADTLTANDTIKQQNTPQPLNDVAVSLSDTAIETSLQALDEVLTQDMTFTQGDTQDTLSTTLKALALSQSATVGQSLSARLQGPFPEVAAGLFEGNVEEPAADVIQWYLLWAIGLNGHGEIPSELLTTPWTTPANDREKYWQPLPAAIWTVEQLGQNDPKTLTALMDRLTQKDDPRWLVGDVVGALSTLTGQQFGYDIDAWQAWWQNRRIDQ